MRLKLDVPLGRRWLPRLARRPLAACAALVLPLALAGGGALAAQTAFSSASSLGAGSPRPAVAAHPHLTTNTSVSCNKPQPKGYARCFAIVRTPSSHVVTADSSGPQPGALGPADIQSAYNLPSATAGGGQTVAIVDAFGDSTAEADLAAFRAQYGLPPCTSANGCFKKVDQTGGTDYPPDNNSPNGGWVLETSLDLDAVSSACPNCNILLVEANSASIDDLGTAVDEAVALGAKFVSNSYGATNSDGSEADLTADDQYYNHPGVAVTASAGDSGYGVNYPSASQYVTAVGGTTLTRDSSVPRGWDESVWGSSSGGEGTGSGCSQYEPQPSSQQGIPQLDAVCKNRAAADVSADANPQDGSGLSVYDTDGEGGWLQVGGTSLASPLIAATYALAGPPAAGTGPNSYPYHDPSQSSDLFDITQGSNGDCGNVLCQAGPGWDGPTGLGTPDGVKAFQGAPQGQITGQVTDQSTGKPVAGATVTAQPGNYITRTDSSGNYDLSVAAGTYSTLAASDFGYKTVTDTNITVTANQATTENFALTGSPSGTLSGTVTDGSGHGWPLHAQITVEGDPNGPFWTNPYTGKYSITLPREGITLDVATDYPGYQAKQVQVTIGANTTQNITLAADLAACTAPGYGPDGLTQGFADWTGGTPQQGWTATSPGGAGWRFDDPDNRPSPPSGSINPVPGTNDKEWVDFDPDHFAVADAGYYNPRPLHTTLTSAPVSLAGQQSPRISFDSAYYPDGGQDTAQVQLSVDGGRTWTTVWQQSASNALGPTAVPIPQAAGKTGVRARWVFDGSGYGYWAIGSVLIGSPACVAQPGGLVAGMVTDKATGNPIGAQVTDAAIPPPYPWPDGIAAATSDPALPGGFYWLFTPAGQQKLTSAQLGYTAATSAVTVQANTIIRQDWALTQAGGS